MAKPIPEGFHSVTPMLTLKNAGKAIEFYKRAFGATEKYSVPGPDGKGIMHAEMQIGNSLIMMQDENPNQPCKSVEAMGCSPVSFYIYVENADQLFQKAVAAGAKSQMPLQEMFWGDRVGTVQDPFGYNWWIATHVKDVSPREMQEGAQAMFAQAGKK
ncbi:MAG: VOC family protein [Actinomycetota bacterium]|nr:VOC family protein [Actinomycetota bacterium]